MTAKSPELEAVIADLKLIKEAVSKSDSIIRFIDIGGALKSVLLIVGLLVAFFAGLFYQLLASYGSFSAIPVGIRAALFVLIGLAWCTTGYLKIRNFMKGARGIRGDITLNRFFDEVYTSRLVALMIPFLLVITAAIIFLCSRGFLIYIIPVLSILLGLLFISTSPIFYLKELYFLSMWLVATGILALFAAEAFHPAVTLVFTFAAGFILSALLLYLKPPGSDLKEG